MRCWIAILFASALAANARIYYTEFPGTENPISEGGIWINGKTTGLIWSNVATFGGVARGQQNNGAGPNYNDSTAVVGGTWGSNQTVVGIINMNGVVQSAWPEAELRTRTTITANSITGEEHLWSLLNGSGSPSQVYNSPVRWNGPYGIFTDLGSPPNSAAYALTNGELVMARAIGNKISLYTMGKLITNVTDSTFLSGSPGIGFDHNDSSSHDSEFGWTFFSASDTGLIYFVRTNGNDANLGLAWTNIYAWKSLAHADSVLTNGDTLIIGAGVTNDWYVDNALTNSANTGTSWANAITNWGSMKFNQFSSPHFDVGDTIWISGGPAGGVRNYYGNLEDAGNNTVDGTAQHPITIRVGNDPLHSGKVRIVGGVSLSRNYWVLDGAINSTWTPANYLQSYYVGTNCNIEVQNTNSSGNGIIFFGSGSKSRWVEVSEWHGGDAGIYVQSTSGTPLGNGTTVEGCYIHGGQGYGLRGEFNNVVSNTFGQLTIRYNRLESVSDNFMQFPGWVDFYKNYCFNHTFPPNGHPDVVQEMSQYARVWKNGFGNNQGAWNYIEANGPLTHDVWVFNNVYFSTAGYYSNSVAIGTNTYANNPGTGFDITGHDSGLGDTNECNQLNLYYWGNTMLMRGDTISQRAAFIWSSGCSNYSGGAVDCFVPRSPLTSWVTNWNAFGNNVIGVAPYNTTRTVELSTNLDFNGGINGYNGWKYTEDQVRFDFNSLNGFSGNGNGITYKDKGSHASGAQQYTNMADFGAATRYKSNNNGTAVYADAPNLDFRPQVGDQALVGKGTNLTALVAAVAPDLSAEVATDILGNPRPAGAWTIGAFELPSGLGSGATYWVSVTNGNDTNAGTFAAPWKTITKGVNTAQPGDTVYVTTGVYNEYPDTVRSGTNGTVGRIRFVAYPANDQAQPVTTYGFRIKHQYITVEGFDAAKAYGINGAMFRIESPSSGGNNGSDCIITNNTIRDSLKAFTQNADFGTNYIHARSFYDGTNFVNFIPGMSVWLGSDGLFPYTNVGLALTVLSISADGNTMYFTTALSPDSGTNYWAAVIAGASGPDSWRGILTTTPSGGFPGCSNIVIAGNIFSNNIGMAIDAGLGDSITVRGNTFTKQHGGYAMRILSSNAHIDHNFFYNSPTINWLTPPEIAYLAATYNDSRHFDWQNNAVTMGGSGQTNIDFSYNWWEGWDNALGELDNRNFGGTMRVHHNVFIGILGAGNASMNNLTYDHNTFVLVSYYLDGAGVLQLGGKNASETDFQLAQTNLTVSSNVFFSFGGHKNLSQEAPYSAVSVTNGVYQTNYSVWPETMGFSNTISPNVGGTFGAGDPLFVNAANPRGPDGIPFTDDDGFRPLPTSPLATLGLGALPPLPSSAPIAHFAIKLASPAWKDATGTNYDLTWAFQKPHERTAVIRPWPTPEAIGSNSITATLDASGSFAPGSITNYTWAFSDGGSLVTNNPVMTHTFTVVGTNTVTLTVTANGSSSTYSNMYRLLGALNDPIITVQPQNQTVCVGQNATVTVTASGGTTLHYQWRFNGVNVGTDSSSYTRPSVVIGDNGGILDVVVNDFAGNITSSSATLTVNPDPVINTQPQNQTVSAGATATFTVAATSCAGTALHFAWTLNGVSVGTDSSSYARPNCQLPDNGGILRVTVSDTAGSLLSSTATLTVNAPLTQLPPTSPGTATAKRGSLNFGGKRRGN